MEATMVLKPCERCHQPYDWKHSNSSLKMTYCGLQCEIGGLGFSMEALEKGQFTFGRQRIAQKLELPPEEVLRDLVARFNEKHGGDDRPLVPA